MIFDPQDVHDYQGGELRNVAKLVFSDPTTRYLQSLAVGTVATVAETGTLTALSFGTTSPALLPTVIGAVYMVWATIQVDRAGATVTTQTLSFKLRQTAGTAADVTAAIVIDLPASTTLTDTLGIYTLGPIAYTAVTATDSISILGAVSAGMGAGTITCVAAGTKIVGVRLS